VSPRAEPATFVVGRARVGRRTKDLVTQLTSADIAVIDHADLDRVAAEGLVEAGPLAVVNAAPSISGRYPNVGPLLLAAAGIPLVDGVGSALVSAVHDGEELTIDGDVVSTATWSGSGRRQTMATLEESIEEAKASLGDELERFAANTLEYIRAERHLLLDETAVPDVGIDFRGRHVLIVVRGRDYREDLAALRQSGYLSQVRPVLIGVDGGADALLELGHKPDVIIGDMDSVSERGLRSGAALVVHAYPGGKAPGSERLDRLGLAHQRFEALGTSEDIAMLLADAEGAELIVAVGTHSSMVEFLDKGRRGMASTFLVRMKVGPILVDAKGVSRLYATGVRKGDVLALLAAGVFVLFVVILASQPARLFFENLWLLVRLLFR
jgi:uncharacterized membrane-anchored protein